MKYQSLYTFSNLKLTLRLHGRNAMEKKKI